MSSETAADNEGAHHLVSVSNKHNNMLIILMTLTQTTSSISTIIHRMGFFCPRQHMYYYCIQRFDMAGHQEENLVRKKMS